MAFTADGVGEHPEPTFFWYFAPMSFGKIMVLPIAIIGNACLFPFLASLHLPVKKYFVDPN